MSFKYFNLQNVKKLINPSRSLQPKSPERRQFVKTMGFGVLAINPVLKTISSFSNQSFDIKHQHNYFAVVRADKVVWEISPNFFGEHFNITLEQDDNDILVKAKNLQLVHTNLQFDLEARIYKEASNWQLQFKIPQFNIATNVDFINWLEGDNSINASVNLQTNLVSLKPQDKIDLNGNFDCQITHNWEFSFRDKSGVLARINDLDYISDHLIITPNQGEFTSIMPSKLARSLRITIDGKEHWKQLLSSLELVNSHNLSTSKDSPSFNFTLGTTESGTDFKALWISEQQGSLQYLDSASANSGVSFSKYFYLSDYSKGKEAEFFLSAKMLDTDQWLTNSIGSFNLGVDTEDAELELFGIGNRVLETRFEPLFKAFQPKIAGALALPTYQDNLKIRLDNTPIDKPTKIKKKFKSIKKGQPILSSRPERLEYLPKGPLKIKVLRPEDMVYLEFEFHNFKFVGDTSSTTPIYIDSNPKKPINTIKDPRKPIHTIRNPKKTIKTNRTLQKPTSTKKVVQQPSTSRFKSVKPANNSISTIRVDNSKPIIAPFNPNAYTAIELDDPNKKGTVIIYFPTQHTLEEAYYETNPNLGDNDGSDPIRLPAKHLRAKKSRLVYELKAKSAGFELSMNELLDWSKFTLKVDPRAHIKLNAISAVHKPTYNIPTNRTKLGANRNTKYLKKKDVNYGVKLVENNKSNIQKARLYEASELNKVLPLSLSETLKPGFRLVKPIVGPITKMHTSIEAPALLYISPNQINDFKHKINLDETGIYSQYPISKGVQEIKPIRRSNELSLKPIQRLGTKNLSYTSNALGTITELWHTHLGVKMKNGKTSTELSKLKTIRALWAHDALKNAQALEIPRNAPFRASLDANYRHKLVHLTSNYSITGYRPIPVPVKKLILSNLGAYLDWHVHFNIPANVADKLNIVEWEHQATLGRDHYVKIVEEGYLFPFGHRAAMVTVTERKFDSKTKAAVNKQRKYIVVLQESVTYERNDPKHNFIKFPFQEVKITVNKTPNIDKPIDSVLYGNGDRLNFLIKVESKGFPFDMVATDKEGGKKHLRMPLAFVENSVGNDNSYIENVINAYNNYNKVDTDIDFLGQEIAYSESLVGGDTSFETKSMHFGAMVYPGQRYHLQFHPIMQSSKVFIESVDKITNSRNPVEISLEDDNNPGDIFASVIDAVVDFSGGSDSSGGFLTPNMPINAISKVQGAIGGVLDELKELKFSPASVFGGVDDVVDGLDGAADLLGRLDNLPIGKIFGVINLASLFLDLDLNTGDLQEGLEEFKAKVTEIKEKIEDLKNKILYYENLAKQTIEEIEAEFNNIENMVNMDVQAEVDAYIQSQIDIVKEQIKTEAVNLVNKLAEKAPKIPNLKTYVTESAFFAEYKYQPEFDGNDNEPIVILEGLLNVEVADKKKALTINTILEKPFELEKPPTISTSARFDNFGIDIVPLLKVNFNYLEFKTGTGTKTDVKVDMNLDNPIEFKGALSFVNSLQNVIPSGGFSDDGPYVDLKPSGVKAGFNISIPNIEVGVCMITNLSLGAYVMLPFTGAPLTLGFNFCTRENPFLLTISAFGGGGYFLMITTLEGIQSMEAAFEFGAAMSMNVGVASGSVTVMGGFYFKMELVKEEVNGEEVEVSSITLTGYLRMNGRLSILGLINASLEFYLALNAIIVDGKVEKMEGTATVKIKVEVLFFSKTVSVTVRRELKGADADPKFVEMIDQDDWQEYCLAFAS